MELYCKKFVYFDWDDILEGKKVFAADNPTKLKELIYTGNLNIKHYDTVKKSTDPDYPFKLDCGGRYAFVYYDPHYDLRKSLCEGKTLQWKNKKDTVWSTWTYNDMPSFDEYTDWRIKPEDYHVVINNGVLAITDKEQGHHYFTGSEEDCNAWIDEHAHFTETMIAWEEGKRIQVFDNDKWNDVNLPMWKTDREYRIKDECTACLKHDTCANPGIKCKSYCTEVKDKYVPFDTVQELITKWEGMNPGCTNRPKCAMPMIWVKENRTDCIYLITGYDENDKNPIMVNDIWISLKDLFNYYRFINDSIIGKRG